MRVSAEDYLAFAGVATTLVGVWLVCPPASVILAGVAMTAASWRVALARAARQDGRGEGR